MFYGPKSRMWSPKLLMTSTPHLIQISNGTSVIIMITIRSIAVIAKVTRKITLWWWVCFCSWFKGDSGHLSIWMEYNLTDYGLPFHILHGPQCHVWYEPPPCGPIENRICQHIVWTSRPCIVDMLSGQSIITMVTGECIIVIIMVTISMITLLWCICVCSWSCLWYKYADSGYQYA